jgi:glycosyltransferase involved in cell wall biosynthesis
MPTVSVVIPTYNRGTFLPSTIESVLQQTFDDFEILVVDDGSTDDTAKIVNGINDNRIHLHSHIRNKGGSAARNTGIEQANGRYIAFLDSDDEWSPSKLEQQVNYLESRSNDWVGVYCDTRSQRHGPSKFLRKIIFKLIISDNVTGRKEGGEELIEDILMTQFPGGGASTLLVRTDIVEQIKGFDPKFQRHQDWEFLIRLVKIGKLGYINQELVIKHETAPPSSTTVEKAKKRYFEKFSEDIAAAEASGLNVTAVHGFDMSCLYFRDGLFTKGLKCLRQIPNEHQQLPRLIRSVLEGLPKYIERVS